jgi:hypothetical protein
MSKPRLPSFSIAAGVLCLTGLALAPTASGQSSKRGPLSALGQGFTLRGDPVLRHKPPGDQVALPPSFAAPAGLSLYPDYRIETLFGAAHAPSIEIDAVSSGNDLIPVEFLDSDYVVQPAQAPLSFVVMQVSLKHGPLPGATGVVGARLQSSPGGVGGDVFSYWFRGNTGVEPEAIDKAYLVAGAEHMGIPGSDLSGLDTSMALIVESNAAGSPFFPHTDAFYFSLTPDAAAYVRQNWSALSSAFAQNVDASDIQAATVFHARWMYWLSSWDRIEVTFTPDDLGLSNEDDIDAVAYSKYTPHMLVYSLPYDPAHPQRSQVQVGFRGFGGGPGHSHDLKANDGLTIEQKLGIPNGGDIDAVCGVDPEESLDPWLGTPYAPFAFSRPPAAIGLSVVRVLDDGRNHSLRVQATGVPTHGYTVSLFGAVGSWVGLLAAVPGNATGQVTLDVPLGTQGVGQLGPISVYAIATATADATTPLPALGSWIVTIDD